MNSNKLFKLFSELSQYKPEDGIFTWTFIQESDSFYYKNTQGRIINHFMHKVNWSTKLQSQFPFPVCVTERLSQYENDREYYVLFYKEHNLFTFEIETDNDQDFYYTTATYTDGYWRRTYYAPYSLSIGKAFISLLAYDKKYRLQAATGNWTFYNNDNRFVPCDHLNGNLYEENEV